MENSAMDSKPSPTHHHIVFLQGAFIPIPEIELPAPYTHTRTVYQHTSPSELHARIHNASIIAICALKLDATALSPEVTPHLKFIAVVASGTDCVDLDACRARGIAVSNCPRVNIESVSEHAIGLYFATRRRLIDMHNRTRAGEWPQKRTLMYNILDKHGQPPLTCQEEVVGIVGNGSVG
jgi:lactate dehydrogenase-like 2-hydroxyacid dehydrogenase